MKESKRTQLFAAARQFPLVQPGSDFAESVAREALRAGKLGIVDSQDTAASTYEALAAILPRWAAAAIALMSLCFATELYQSWQEPPPDLGHEATQWFFSEQ